MNLYVKPALTRNYLAKMQWCPGNDVAGRAGQAHIAQRDRFDTEKNLPFISTCNAQ